MGDGLVRLNARIVPPAIGVPAFENRRVKGAVYVPRQPPARVRPWSAGKVCTHSHISLSARAEQLIYTSVEGDATQSPDSVQ
jgi:hypothetical protein